MDIDIINGKKWAMQIWYSIILNAGSIVKVGSKLIDQVNPRSKFASIKVSEPFFKVLAIPNKVGFLILASNLSEVFIVLFSFKIYDQNIGDSVIPVKSCRF